MSFTDIFIKRPVLALVLSILIVVAGLQAIYTIPMRQYPRIDAATVVVRTAYVGANAELVRGFITTPLERVISGVEGIDYIESSSAQGLSTITVFLELNYDTIKALSAVQSKVNQVRGDLPPEAEVPIINIQGIDDRMPGMFMSFNSTIIPRNQINDYLLRVVQPRISAIPGVQRADIF